MRTVKVPAKLWAGFVDGKMDIEPYRSTDHLEEPIYYGVLYGSRKEARRRYEDVRRVEIREVKP